MYISHVGAQLYTVSFGAGPRTLLAFGGWAGNWELWAEPFMALSQSWRTVAYDHRGTGATIAPVESITIDAMTADVFAVMDALTIPHCVLAAESAGAAVAVSAVLAQPDRFSGLVLVDALLHRPAPQGPDPFVEGLQKDFSGTLARFAELCAPGAENEAIRYWGRRLLARTSPAAAVQLQTCLYGLDLRAAAAQLTLPTLLIHGEGDRLVSSSDSRALAEQIPNSRLHVLPGAGHVPTMTDGATIANLINDYFV